MTVSAGCERRICISSEVMKVMNRTQETLRRCALVTGASSGLGRAIALELARVGVRLVLTGRSETRLEETRRVAVEVGQRPDQVSVIAADLTQDEGRARIVETVAEQFGGVLDWVIHGAGAGAYGRFLSHEPSILTQLLALNCVAVAELSRGLYPLLSKGDRPGMAVIGSIVARRALPGRSEYSASKFALAGWVDAVRCEWSGAGIHVLLVNPGFTRTEFESNVLVDTAFVKAEHRRSMSAEAVARATVRALKHRRSEITLTGQGRLLLWTDRLMPGLVRWGLSRWTRRLYQKHKVYEG